MPIDVKNIPLKEIDHKVDDPEKDVQITILFGNGQTGGSRIEDSSEKLIAKGRIVKKSLGKGKELVGKRLIFYSNVLDTNQEDPENWVFVEYIFSNTLAAYNFKDMAPENGIVSYQIIYNFI